MPCQEAWSEGQGSGRGEVRAHSGLSHSRPPPCGQPGPHGPQPHRGTAHRATYHTASDAESPRPIFWGQGWEYSGCWGRSQRSCKLTQVAEGGQRRPGRPGRSGETGHPSLQPSAASASWGHQCFNERGLGLLPCSHYVPHLGGRGLDLHVRYSWAASLTLQPLSCVTLSNRSGPFCNPQWSNLCPPGHSSCPLVAPGSSSI